MMDTAFFWLSKLVWSVIAPESLLLILLVLGWVLLLRGAVRRAKAVLSLAILSLLLLSVVPVGDWVIAPLETRFPAHPSLPPRIDGIIVLGGAEDPVRSAAWGQVETNGSAERFLASLALAKRHPEAKLLFTSGGGAVTNQQRRSADVARMLFAEQGINADRLVFERESRNTAENVRMSKALVQPKRGEVWVLVTSASHMSRSVGIFCKSGWPVIPYPVDHHSLPEDLFRFDTGTLGNLDNLSLATKEWVGLVVYYVTGRTNALFPEGCALQGNSPSG